jgi:hypothetical protein
VASKAAGALIAAFAVGLIALAVARRDDPPPPPQATPSVSTEADDAFAALRARPLHRPRLRKGVQCPDPERGVDAIPAWIPAEAGLGVGSVHAVSRAIPRFLDFFLERGVSGSSPWRRNETVWLSEPGYRGPLLVRGAKVRGGRLLGFGTAYSLEYELRLPAGPWDEKDGPIRVWDTVVRPAAGWRVAVRATRALGTEAGKGCYFLQFDGESFSESVLVGVLIQP